MQKHRIQKRPGDWFCPGCFKHNFAANSECVSCNAKKDYKCVVQVSGSDAPSFPKSPQKTKPPTEESPTRRCKLDWIYCTGACASLNFDLHVDIMSGFIDGSYDHVANTKPPPSTHFVVDEKWRTSLDESLRHLGMLSASISITKLTKAAKKPKKVKEDKKLRIPPPKQLVTVQKNSGPRPSGQLYWENLAKIESSYFEQTDDTEIDQSEFEENIEEEETRATGSLKGSTPIPTKTRSQIVEFVRNAPNPPPLRVVGREVDPITAKQETWWKSVLASGYNEEYALMLAMQLSAEETGEIPAEFKPSNNSSKTPSQPPSLKSSTSIPRPSPTPSLNTSSDLLYDEGDEYFDFFDDSDIDEDAMEYLEKADTDKTIVPPTITTTTSTKTSTTSPFTVPDTRISLDEEEEEFNFYSQKGNNSWGLQWYQNDEQHVHKEKIKEEWPALHQTQPHSDQPRSTTSISNNTRKKDKNKNDWPELAPKQTSHSHGESSWPSLSQANKQQQPGQHASATKKPNLPTARTNNAWSKQLKV